MEPRSLKQIQYLKLHQQVAQQLEELIIDGHWKVGDTLPTERELTQKLGVSRTAVRDAIRILAAKGLVETKHGIGAIVTQDGRTSFIESLSILLRRGNYTQNELLEVRKVLEAEIVGLAAERASEEDLEEMRAALESYRLSIQNHENVQDLHKAFHLSLVKATHNRILADFITPILAITVALTQPKAHKPHSLADHEIHEAIYNRIKARDVEGAREAMHRHMKLTLEESMMEVREMKRDNGPET
ncbi:MAG: FadR family transcriptional regulator [Chloroflexi bacterium]|nr:FadR family transcriptional regulator [Chloroflexota bacterium]